ncbi:MAG TPA: hypothetical protein VH969_12020 [Actinophytocola sp.]|jgi:ornithine cyclodeaminase/alanine dehydrogenase-like protein (mu-crystallin family)|uniref:hypothetical protein n=1 Tax=Actinophytocola sp. TaxID=1872138 RepID=UPI002F94359F
MTGTVLQLGSREVWRALDVIDPVATMAEFLIDRTVGRAGHDSRSRGRLISWSDTASNGTGLVLLDHPDVTGTCVLPAETLRSSQAVVLAAVAAREMLVSGGVTMAVIGPPADTEPQLSVLARHVPDISHVAVCSDRPDLDEVGAETAEQLEKSGIGLSVVSTVADAVFGANLVVTTDHSRFAKGLAGLRIGNLARGALLVNASGTDLPAELVDHVDEVYVDDLGLVDHHPDRHVVATSLAARAAGTATGRLGIEPRIAGDLVQLLTGRHADRRRSGDIVLMELLGGHELNADLAYRIYEVAAHTSLGVRIAN